MSYKTDLMEQILTSKEAQTIIEYVSPVYGESYVGLWLFQVIGAQLDDMLNWSEDLYNQVTPQTATWTIEYWEKEYGIVPEADWTIEQRQQNIMSKMKYRAPMSPKKIEDLASAILGVPVEIEENTAKNTFTVYVRKNVTEEKFARAKQEIDNAKPAHLIYNIHIAELKEALVNTAATMVAEVNKKHIVEVS